MYNQPNKLLTPTSRVIKPYACAMIATEGPNILGKIDLAGIEIEYESQFTSRMILNPNASKQPIFYGFLGNDVTFLLLKVTYDETNPYCVVEENQYIEYYFNTNSDDVKYIHKLMILTGNSTKRIPQIYLSNPSDSTVIVDVMVANLAQEDLTSTVLPANIALIDGIYHNNILTDSIYNSTTHNYGSSQFTILDYEGNYVLYLNYTEIDTIQLDETKNKIIIDTKSDTYIHLQFLSVFEMYQAYSRIDWVMKDPLNRSLTRDLPNVDTTSPEIIMKQVSPILENIYTFHVDTNLDNTFVLTKQQVVDLFINGINDNRDGEISVNNLNVTIRKFGELLNINEITEEGAYDIIMSISDVANNKTIANYILIIDITKPIINFAPTQNDTYTLSLLNDGNNGVITKTKIQDRTIYSITDNIDVILPSVTTSDISGIQTKSITLTILNNQLDEVSEIVTSGTYTVNYIVNDLSNNLILYVKTIIVTA